MSNSYAWRLGWGVWAIASLCAVSECGHAAEPRVPVAEYVFDVALAADMATTLDIRKHADCAETNPILGRHPSDARVIAYGIAAGIAHYAVTRELLRLNMHRTLAAWEVLTIGVEFDMVAHNYSLGLTMRFP